MTTLGALCDRCSTPYLATTWPHLCLCAPCQLGGMKPADRDRLLGHIASRKILPPPRLATTARDGLAAAFNPNKEVTQ
jgi:hypothetical protein